MRVVATILVIIICFVSEIRAQEFPGNDTFTSPVRPPFFFAGNFGELRPSHFHSGLDFRTQGRTGLPVFAVKEGYISRIAISSSGYGNALYMNHADGTTTVYGHLQRFHPKLQKFIQEKQYDRESFVINITLRAGEFSFKKGDIIAWSGNSGSSGGPHLHFEIRDTQSERAFNPLHYHFSLKDNSAPKITALYVYPLSAGSNIGQERTKKRFETVSFAGGYRLKNKVPLELNGKIGFGIQTEDYFNGTGLKCGIYSATLLCDGKVVFGFKMNSFSFSDSRYADSQSDYEEYIRSHRWIQRLYRQPGNYLDIYEPSKSDGIENLEDGKGHEFEIIVYDAFKNKTSLKYRSINKISRLPAKIQSFNKLFLFDQSNIFENDKIRINIPKGALYDNLGFVWKATSRPVGCYSELHQVNSKFIPVHIPYSLSIKCDDLPKSLESKAIIVLVDKDTGHKTAIGGEYSDGWVSTKTNQFGSFCVVTDKTSPLIIPLSIKDKKRLIDSSKVQFKITDDLSGIQSYRGEIDGRWVLFEYDAKSATLSYTFDKERMVFGKSHLLRLVVTDFKENSTEYKAIIYK